MINRPTIPSIADSVVSVIASYREGYLHPRTVELLSSWVRSRAASPDAPNWCEIAMDFTVDVEASQDLGRTVYDPASDCDKLRCEIDQSEYRFYINGERIEDRNFAILHRYRRGIMPQAQYNEMVGHPRLI